MIRLIALILLLSCKPDDINPDFLGHKVIEAHSEVTKRNGLMDIVYTLVLSDQTTITFRAKDILYRDKWNDTYSDIILSVVYADFTSRQIHNQLYLFGDIDSPNLTFTGEVSGTYTGEWN